MKLDFDKLKELDVKKEDIKTILFVITQISFGFAKFQHEVIENPYICNTCLLRAYIEKAFEWESILAIAKTIKEKEDPLQLYLREIFLCSYAVRCAGVLPDYVVKHGQDVMKLKDIKDKEIDVLRLYGLMTNLLLKELYKKVLDRLTQVVYDMDVKPCAIHYIMGSFIFIMMEYIGSWMHMFNEKTLTGNIIIYKIGRENNTGLSCEEPLDIEYKIINKKGK